MNITDIDDKIIKRARQQFLIDRQMKDDVKPEKLVENLSAALIGLRQKITNEITDAQKFVLEVLSKKCSQVIVKLETSLREKDVNGGNALVLDAREILAECLDIQYGNSITDRNIFAELARKYETDFYADMKSLNVQPPDILTRVSDYIPQIVDFIDAIIQNGYAYASNGSVYFDTLKFDQHNDHCYAKLMPDMFANRQIEGDDDRSREKRNVSDFALWKASKIGEPCWPSKWGDGRPGWHVECSVMATEICGQTLDVHAGGVDLKFPHHDNELAQTEARFERYQWVNYFLHVGSLTVQGGVKMSKSLKNFVTVKDALKLYTPRQLRLYFLHHNWYDGVEYSPPSISAAIQFEKTCEEFFLSTKQYVRQYFDDVNPSSYVKFDELERNLYDRFLNAKQKIHEAMCDSIDTRTTMEIIKELISSVHVYTVEKRQIPNVFLLRNIALYITKILKTFGVATTDEEIGFGELNSERSSSTTNKEQLLTPYLQSLADFRQKIRTIAIEGNLREILIECDRLRNDVLPPLGVRLEDRREHTMVKFCDPETLNQQRQQRTEQKERSHSERERKQRLAEARRAERETKRKIPPKELFLNETKKYSRFDDRGIPTHDDKGVEFNKRMRKKLEKLFVEQQKLYDEYLATKNDR